MPRETVLLGTRPLLLEDLRAAVLDALPAADFRPVQGGEAVQVLDGAALLLTVVRPRAVATRQEAVRLLPGRSIPEGAPLWWVDVVLAPGAAPDRADAVVAALAAAIR